MDKIQTAAARAIRKHYGLNRPVTLTYTDHNDARGRDNRLAVQAWNATRARMLTAFYEYDLGCVTLYMSKADLRARRLQGMWHGTCGRNAQWGTPDALESGTTYPVTILREPRNEREAAKLLRAQA